MVIQSGICGGDDHIALGRSSQVNSGMNSLFQDKL
jgi:hypothetical protein